LQKVSPKTFSRVEPQDHMTSDAAVNDMPSKCSTAHS
jgi:hypothetical protein